MPTEDQKSDKARNTLLSQLDNTLSDVRARMETISERIDQLASTALAIYDSITRQQDMSYQGYDLDEE